MANTIDGNSLGSQQLYQSQRNLNKSLSRLASGLRINSAKDDAAGLAISDRFNSQIRGLNQAMRNTNDGLSLTQTADGALSESTGVLQRMRELAVQSANGIYNDQDRTSMNQEFVQLQGELDSIANETTFNNLAIIDGNLADSGLNFQVGAQSDQAINVTIGGATQADLGTNALAIDTAGGAQDALTSLDNALATVSDIRGNLGAIQNRFESTISNLGNIAESSSAANSRIVDADMAQELTNRTTNLILQQAGLAIRSQTNASAESMLGLIS